MELTIKTAAAYEAQGNAVTEAARTALRNKVIKFINEEVQPMFERMIASPQNFTSVGGSSFKIPGADTKAFVAMVSELLTPAPYNYQVYETHDGGGMYPMVAINYIKKDRPPVYRAGVSTTTTNRPAPRPRVLHDR